MVEHGVVFTGRLIVEPYQSKEVP